MNPSNNIFWHIEVKARINLLPSSISGRTQPIFVRYNPNHKLKNGLFYMGALMKIENGKINPGESAIADITFVVSEQALPFFKEGLIWDIHEGRVKVGTGEILLVYEKNPAPS